MASGRNARSDGRWFVSPCRLTTTLLIFFSLGCFVLWMETYSSILPVHKVSFSQNKSKEKQLENQTDYEKLEDSARDLPDDAMAVDTNLDTSQDDKNPNIWENGDTSEQSAGSKTEEKLKESDGKRTADDTSKAKPKYDGDEEAKSGETKTEDEESNTDSEDTRADDGRENTGKDESMERSNDRKQDNESLEKHSGSIGDEKKDDKESYHVSNDALPDGIHSEILDEANTTDGAWSTQDIESRNAKESQHSSDTKNGTIYGYSWKACNVSAGPDYIPCLDNVEAIRKLRSTKHYEHRERHCPDEAPTCLVSLPEGYKRPIGWPTSRDKVWYNNVPHTKLAEVKSNQNWVKVSGEYLTFPGGGTQFKHGALHYIDFLQDAVPDIAWGNRTRVILDVGCGVASFGGYLFESDVLTMSLAPKDEHEAQVQFALERGIPAISAVMGTKRLPFPGMVFDVVHCARCRVPWHIEGGKLLLELNRLLRPGGYFVWSATPVYNKKLEEDVDIWKAMSTLTKNMCWELMVIKKDKVNRVGAALYRKPSSNECYEKRQKEEPPLCKESDDPNAAWNVPLQACMHKVPSDASERGSRWPEKWPKRLEKPPYWLKSTQPGAYGKSAPDDFSADYEHWKRLVDNSYLNGIGIKWSSVRNVMDMRSIYGGFAAALKDLKVWVMNVVPIDSPDTLPIIYERGLFGMYHDWCESFSTYPRSYDLLHADHLFSTLKKRCNLVAVIAEVDRILRPEGKLIVRDKADTVSEVENMVKSLHWEIRITYFKENEGLLCVQKSMWRPKEVETIASAIE